MKSLGAIVGTLCALTWNLPVFGEQLTGYMMYTHHAYRTTILKLRTRIVYTNTCLYQYLRACPNI